MLYNTKLDETSISYLQLGYDYVRLKVLKKIWIKWDLNIQRNYSKVYFSSGDINFGTFSWELHNAECKTIFCGCIYHFYIFSLLE